MTEMEKLDEVQSLNISHLKTSLSQNQHTLSVTVVIRWKRSTENHFKVIFFQNGTIIFIDANVTFELVSHTANYLDHQLTLLEFETIPAAHKTDEVIWGSFVVNTYLRKSRDRLYVM